MNVLELEGICGRSVRLEKVVDGYIDSLDRSDQQDVGGKRSRRGVEEQERTIWLNEGESLTAIHPVYCPGFNQTAPHSPPRQSILAGIWREVNAWRTRIMGPFCLPAPFRGLCAYSTTADKGMLTSSSRTYNRLDGVRSGRGELWIQPLLYPHRLPARSSGCFRLLPSQPSTSSTVSPSSPRTLSLSHTSSKLSFNHLSTTLGIEGLACPKTPGCLPLVQVRSAVPCRSADVRSWTPLHSTVTPSIFACDVG